jgi:hypothetical protein
MFEKLKIAIKAISSYLSYLYCYKGVFYKFFLKLQAVKMLAIKSNKL